MYGTYLPYKNIIFKLLIRICEKKVYSGTAQTMRIGNQECKSMGNQTDPEHRLVATHFYSGRAGKSEPFYNCYVKGI